jgi:acid phosphatase type 7
MGRISEGWRRCRLGRGAPDRGKHGSRRKAARAVVLATASLALAAVLAPSGPAPAATTQAAGTAPVRAAFYYPWSLPDWPSSLASLPYAPELGAYDSATDTVVQQQVRWMRYANVDAGIAYWNGQLSDTDSRISGILRATGDSPVKWSLFYEPEANSDPTVAEIQADLAYISARYASQPQYLRIADKPVLFVHAGAADTCDLAQRWADANTAGFYLVLDSVSGFASCAAQPDSWFDYAPQTAESHLPGYSYAISPGYWKLGDPQPTRVRMRGTEFDTPIQNMVASNEPLQLIETWNKWDEGSQVEPATTWISPVHCLTIGRLCTGIYLNRLHRAVPESIVSAAGDIACDPTDADFNNGLGVIDPVDGACRQAATAPLLAGSDAVLALGDTQYEASSTANYAASYDRSWGAYKDITHPIPGDHEYQVPGAADYFNYFGSAAGDPSKGYYFFDIGSWHIVALNSECDVVSCAAGGAQETWLKGDLHRHRNFQCTLAIWHFPHFSDGPHVPDELGSTAPFWQDLYDAGAELVLSGNDHNYQRFAPMKADGTADPAKGIRQFIVGTGGKSFTTPTGSKAEVRHPGSFGVLRLTLYANRYEWQFVPEGADTTGFTDSGSGTCH